MAELAGKCPEVRAADRGAVFEVVKKDINSFDVETELAPADLRLLRLSLSSGTKRNHLLLTRLLEAGASEADSACRLVQEKPELLRTLPATPRDRNFWRLLERYRARVPDETYGYVVGIVAAAAVAAAPNCPARC